MSSELWKILYDVGIFRCMMCCEVGTVLMKLSAVHIKSTQTPVCIGQMYYKIYIYIYYILVQYILYYTEGFEFESHDYHRASQLLLTGFWLL